MKGLGVLFVALLFYDATCAVAAFTVTRNARQLSPPPSQWSHFQAARNGPSSSSRTTTLVTSLRASAISPGDTVLVVGGTGGVGQLVTKKLHSLGDYNVRVTSRDEARGRETIENAEVDVVAVDLIADDTAAALEASMKDVSAVVISVGTTAFPTTKWAGGNTPQAIDKNAVQKIATAAQMTPGMKKVVLLTSVGVDRTKEMPFLILNLFGVLDAKKSGEEAIKSAATEAGFDYAIVRPGRLVGGPYTNLDLAKLMQVEGGECNQNIEPRRQNQRHAYVHFYV
jgi:nucleoside-diphosphate-sugar epimerase